MGDLKLIDVRPKDIYTTIEISKEGVIKVLDFLNNCTCSYDSKEQPELEKAVMYVKNEFFPFLIEVEKVLKNVT